LAFADFNRSPGRSRLARTGSDVAVCATRVRDHLRRRLRKPDRRLRSLAPRVDESGTARRRSYDDGGSAAPEGRATRLPRAPAGRTRIRGAVEGARSASPIRSKRRFDPPLASRVGCELEPRRAAPDASSSPLAFRREREGRDDVRFEGRPRRGGRSSPRDASNFQANNPLFKERAPELHADFRSSLLSPRGPASVALHDASLASDHLSSAWEAACYSDSAREPAFV
jgi:hypothetical protein